MPAGPIEEGSIVARLKVDSSAWNAELDKAELKATELGRSNPTIRVESEVAAAIGKLNAVSAATDKVALAKDRLTLAERRATDTASSAYIANLRLEALMNKRGRTELQVAVATEALGRADRAAEAAELKLIVANETLASAERDAATAALEEAAAQDVNTVATDKAAKANGVNVSRMGLIVAAVAILVPMLGPLVAYSTAVAGALAGMGAAGLLAILGIKNAMAAGTEQGAHYSAGLQALKADLSGLENTAASAMLGAFDTAVKSINQALPGLNGQIQTFSTMLGVVGNSVLSGVINAFRILNPLFVTAGHYVEGLAGGFLSWTNNGGLSQFASYALSVLPQVEETLGALSRALIHILDALTPLGVVGLAIIEGVSQAISAIPVPVLTDLIAAATAGFLAFKMWALLVPVINAVSVAITGATAVTEAAAGPIGWVVLAVAALAAAFAVSAQSATAATAATSNYTDSLKQDNGVLGANVRAQLAKALVESDAIKNAKLLGIGAKELTDAVMGESAAHADVNAKIKAGIDNYQKQVDLHGYTTSAVYKEKVASEALRDTIKAQNDEITKAVKGGVDYSQAMSLGGSVAQTLATDLGMTVAQYTALVAAQNTATAAAKTWKTEIDILNGVTQSLEQTNINLASDYQSMATQIVGNIKSMGRAAATSLDINTAGGLANHTIILKSIQDAQTESTAIVAAEKDTAQAHEDGRLALLKSRQSIIDHMVSAGLDATAVQGVVDALMHIPAHVNSQIEIDTASAVAKIVALNALIAAAPAAARTSVGVDLSKVPSKWQTHADGGTVSGGGSGTSDSVPMWASNGEEVIRTAAASFNRPFLKAYNANPAQALRSVATAGKQIVHNHTWNITTVADPGALATEAVRRINMSIA